MPLGSFPGSTYDEVTLDLARGRRVRVLHGRHLRGARTTTARSSAPARLCDVVEQHRDGPAREIVDAIFEAVHEFRGDAPQNDDMTAVAVKITLAD